MRRLALPTCLFLAAWSQPTGPSFDIPAPISAEKTANVSTVEKTILAATASSRRAAPLVPIKAAAPAETTEDLMTFDGEAAEVVVAIPAEIEVAAPAIPMPLRRPVPHTLVCEELAAAAANNNLPAPFLIKLINQESGFKQNAVSPVGAQGIAQFMPGTAAQMRLDDPFNPLKALHASAQLLRNLLEQFGNKLGLAAAAYNAGPRRVQDWLDKKGKLPEETRNYVERITGRKAEEWKSDTVAQLRVPKHAPCQREAGLFAANGPAAIPLPPSKGGAVMLASAGPDTPLPAARAEKPGRKSVTLTIAAKSSMKSKTKSETKSAGFKAADGKGTSKSATGKSGKTKTADKEKTVRVAEAKAKK